MTLEKLLKSYIQDDIIEVKSYLGKKFHLTTGNNCVGDIVWFGKDIFSGSFRNAKFDGTECVRAVIVKDSYGKDKQQHTFTLALMKSAHSKTFVKGSEFKIKGRNLYKHFTYCENYMKEERKSALDEKYLRGSVARAEREERKNENR